MELKDIKVGRKYYILCRTTTTYVNLNKPNYITEDVKICKILGIYGNNIVGHIDGYGKKEIKAEAIAGEVKPWWRFWR